MARSERTAPPLLAIVALALLPPTALLVGGATSWRWIGAGALTWAVAVVLKAGPGAALWWALERAGVPARARCAAWGVWSAACELGLTAIVFLRAADFPSLVDMVGFGVGAGSLEALLVAGAGAASAMAAARGTSVSKDEPPMGEPRSPESGKEQDSDAANRSDSMAEGAPAGPVWAGVIERALASVGHVASRGLVWIGVQSWAFAPAALVAVATFAVIDGVATWGSEADWDWSSPTRLRWFYGVVAAVTAVEVVVLLSALWLLPVSAP